MLVVIGGNRMKHEEEKKVRISWTDIEQACLIVALICFGLWARKGCCLTIFKCGWEKYGILVLEQSKQGEEFVRLKYRRGEWEAARSNSCVLALLTWDTKALSHRRLHKDRAAADNRESEHYLCSKTLKDLSVFLTYFFLIVSSLMRDDHLTGAAPELGCW